jgi:hypothetical protein
VNRTRGDEPLGAVIHVCMEILQGTSLLCIAVFISNSQKRDVFLFSYTKSGEQENRTGPVVGVLGEGRLASVKR